MGRVLAWFSCGRASAVAAKMAVDKYGDDCVVAYCASVETTEHPDNQRFIRDCEHWYGRPILRLYSQEYKDTWAVWEHTGWLVGVGGARCTTELKKRVRFAFQRPDDLHVFGMYATERKRIDRLRESSPELALWFPLLNAGADSRYCNEILAKAGIELPVMYRMGYRNNNCIGCVKGGTGYWNKIRRDFPDVFERMAKLERKLDVAICKTEPVVNGKRKRIRVFLDELDPSAGRYEEEPEWECGVACGSTVA